MILLQEFSLETKQTYNLLEEGAADALHTDTERNLVAEATSELHHLQLAQTVGALQGHQHQRADPWAAQTMPSWVCSLLQQLFHHTLFTWLAQQLWFLLQLHHIFIEAIREDHKNLEDQHSGVNNSVLSPEDLRWITFVCKPVGLTFTPARDWLNFSWKEFSRAVLK